MVAVAGIDLAAGRGVTEVAILVAQPDSTSPRFQIEQHRPVVTDEDIVAVIAQTAPAAIAIDAPLTLPAAVTHALQSEAYTQAPKPIAHAPDFQSRAHFQQPASSSPYTRAAERDPIWKTLGLRPLPVSFLGGLAFRAITLLPQLRMAAPDARIIEVFPTATLRALGIHASIGQEKRQPKTTPIMRTATQHVLSQWIDGIPASSIEPLSADLLDALAAALTAVFFLRGAFVTAGAAVEGQIILPQIEPVS